MGAAMTAGPMHGYRFWLGVTDAAELYYGNRGPDATTAFTEIEAVSAGGVLQNGLDVVCRSTPRNPRWGPLPPTFALAPDSGLSAGSLRCRAQSWPTRTCREQPNSQGSGRIRGRGFPTLGVSDDAVLWRSVG